jgi:hypothetical protein
VTEDMPDTLAAATALLQTKLPDIRKSETALVKSDKGSYSYTYADLAQITREVMPLLGALGLSFVAKPTLNADGKFVLAYKLLHVSGEHEDGEYPLPASGTPQAIGSAITYGRRYSLCAVTGIAPEEDDDGAAAHASTEGQRGSAQRAASQRRQSAQSERPAQPDQPQAQRAQRPTGDLPPLPSETDRMTPKQQGMLHALFTKGDMTDRAVRMQYVNEVLAEKVGPARRVESSGELSKTEAGYVIDKLQKWANQLEPTSDTDGAP